MTMFDDDSHFVMIAVPATIMDPVIVAIFDNDCGSFHLLARKLSPRDLGLLQQNLPIADIPPFIRSARRRAKLTPAAPCVIDHGRKILYLATLH
jgi:hypothetical protein